VGLRRSYDRRFSIDVLTTHAMDFQHQQEANKSAAGKRGIRVLFHAGRTCPALPERYRSLIV
jgi:hypothetical protein